MPTPNIDKRDARGWTALMIAARFGTPQQVSDLLEAGANTQVKDRFSLTPLAISHYYNPSVRSILFNARTSRMGIGPTRYDCLPAHHAVRYGDVQLLRDALASGANPNQIDANGHTPLHIAVRYATPQMIGELVEAGACVEALHAPSRRPIHVAALHGPNENLVALLNLGADPTARVDIGDRETPLMLATRNARTSKNIRTLTNTQNNANLNEPDANGMTLLRRAIKAALPNNVRELLKLGADPNYSASGYSNTSPICYAYMELGQRKPEELKTIISILLEHNAKTSDESCGEFALYDAARYASPAHIQQLIDAGCDVHSPYPSRPSILSGALDGSSRENLQFLLGLGVDPDGQPDASSTPLNHATGNAAKEDSPLASSADERPAFTLLEDLLIAGADPNQPDKSHMNSGPCINAAGRSTTVIKLLLKYGANPNGASPSGTTALMAATMQSNAEGMQVLLAAGATLEAKNDEGCTALFFAVHPRSIEPLRVLLAAGADANARSNNGSTAAHNPWATGYLGVMHALLQGGIDPNATNDNGHGLLSRQEEHGWKHGWCPKVNELLKKWGATPNPE